MDSDVALHGVRVLDLSRLLPGPFCTQILADLGAEVIKVEDTGAGDYARFQPPLAKDGQGVLFHALNRGKKSITINLTEPGERDRFLRLVRSADVVVEGFRPGVLAKFGLGPSELRRVNPRLIVCSISGFGQTGPMARRAGHDAGYLARAGVLAPMVSAPQLPPVQIADLAGGAWPAVAQILAALYRRSRTGLGTVIDISMTHNAYALNVFGITANADRPVYGPTLLHGACPCYGVYPCRDGFVAVGAVEPKFWNALVCALDLPDLRDRGLDEGASGAEVRAQLAAALARRSRAECDELFARIDCACEVIRTPPEARTILGPETVEARVQWSDGDVLAVPRVPLVMDGVRIRSEPAPRSGAHNDEILSRL